MSSRYEGRRAVIYTRVSKDRAGGRSVAEQEAECRIVCQREGWSVADVLSDNDVGASRWSKGDRPNYDRLSRILQPGDVLVTWEASRAQRDLAAYNDLRQLCTERDVLWCYSGRVFDLTRSDDRFMTLLDIGLAEKEVDQTRERIMRTLRANLQAGKPHGIRPYGYRSIRDPDTGKPIGREPDPVEGPIVRGIVDRFLSGVPLRRIAIDLNASGVKPQRAEEWTASLLGKMLQKPAYAGLLTHHGEIVGPGTWPAIITEDEHYRIMAILKDPARRTQRGTSPKSLVTNIAVCGKCGSTVRRKTKAGRTVYVCRDIGCVTMTASDVDEYVEEWMFKLLSDPRVHRRVSQQGDSKASADALAKIDGIRARMDEYAVEAAKGDISPRAFALMEKQWLTEIAELEQVANQALIHPRLADLTGPYVEAVWADMDLDLQRDIVRSTLEVTLYPQKLQREQDKPPIEVLWRT
ncbi:resolvase [Rhodococcus phage REQ1]|uniref:integrase n=1 Tax=Rhodococcus phage REQ1 TaxID=1109712 RepID=UPI00023EEBF7|nr:integrase [Rhodococcus phage REQ1]AEV52018.1 resolvase [Rhodococcus phage REQ1]